MALNPSDGTGEIAEFDAGFQRKVVQGLSDLDEGRRLLQEESR